MKYLLNLTLIACMVILSSCASQPIAKAGARQPVPRTEAECVKRGGQWIFEGTAKRSKYCYL